MSLPPGPSSNFLEQHYRWYTKPFQFMKECSDKYGDPFTLRVGSGAGDYPMVFLSDPKHIEALLCADPNLFLSGEGNKGISTFLGEHSLLTADGANHLSHRRLMAPPLHGDKMRALSRTMLLVTKNALQTIKSGQAFSVREWMQNVSLNIILRTVLGVEENDLGPELNDLMTYVLHSGMTVSGYLHIVLPILRQDLGPFSWWGRYERRRKQLDETIYTQINACKNGESPQRSDILAMLASVRDSDNRALSDQEIRDEVMTLLVAGHETTAAAISWALFWIHYTPGVKENLLRELLPLKDRIDECCLDESKDTAYITQLPYLTAVCQEALRITPAVPIAFMRLTKEKFTLLDYEFEADTNLLPCIYLVHQRGSIYENPTQYRPERFLEKEFSQYEFFPFGGGARRCIGASFAMQEMKLVLAMLFSSTDLKAEHSLPVEPTRRGIAVTIPDAYRLVKIGNN